MYSYIISNRHKKRVIIPLTHAHTHTHSKPPTHREHTIVIIYQAYGKVIRGRQ